MKFFTTLFLLVMVCCVHAQWSADAATNNVLCTQLYDQQDVKITEDGKGGALITWLDYRADAAMKKGDIYVQRINSSGAVLWTANGIGACVQASDQTAPAIVSDSAGGAFIIWVDFRNGNRDVYIQKIDSNGVAQWTANGVGIAVGSGQQQNPRIINDGAQGAIVVYEDSVSNKNISAQRIDGNGNILWTGGGVVICNANGFQINPHLVTDGSNGAVITWQDKRNGSDYDIYAQGVAANGTIQWTSNGIVLCQFATTQSNPKITPDYLGGAIVAWQDKRMGVDFDIYAQYINGNGVTQWTSGGKSICSAAGSQSAIDMINDTSINGAIISWKDGRNGQMDIYAQKISYSGTLQWTANGAPVVNTVFDQINPNVISDVAGGAIVAWQDSSAGNWDVRTQHLSANGAMLWKPAGIDVGVAANHQTGVKNISDGNGGSIYAFQDKRNTIDFDVYVFKVNANGNATGIKNYEKNQFSVYPNPSHGNVNFVFPDDGKYVLKVFNLLGEEVLSTSVYQQNHSFDTGVYFYNINNSQQQIKGKFVVE